LHNGLVGSQKTRLSLARAWLFFLSLLRRCVDRCELKIGASRAHCVRRGRHVIALAADAPPVHKCTWGRYKMTQIGPCSSRPQLYAHTTQPCSLFSSTTSRENLICAAPALLFTLHPHSRKLQCESAMRGDMAISGIAAQ
jgi:hypothetical protein